MQEKLEKKKKKFSKLWGKKQVLERNKKKIVINILLNSSPLFYKILKLKSLKIKMVVTLQKFHRQQNLLLIVTTSGSIIVTHTYLMGTYGGSIYFFS